MATQPRIVILGGGFGGLNAAKALRKAEAQITVIDRANHHLFQPLLYQVATATLSPADVAMPIRHILRNQKNTEVLLGEVIDIDLIQKQVIIADASPVTYDYLVVATGATHSYFGHPEWEHYARGLKTIDDATYIRGEVLAAFEYAERASSEKEKQDWMTVIIVGAGPTGAELAGAFAEISRKVLKNEFRHIQPKTARVILVEGTDRIVSVFAPSLSERARRDLENLGVDVRLDTFVQSIDSCGVGTNKGRIEGRTVIWAAGVQASPAAKWLKTSADKVGRVHVNPDLSIANHPEIFVLGDCAHAVNEHGELLPGVAPVAIQQGHFIGRKLRNILAGKQDNRPFHYFNKGILATIGRRRAIAQTGKIRIAGWIAWLGWLFIHIMYLIGFRNKISVLLQWAWAYFTWDLGARLITPAEWARMRPQDAQSCVSNPPGEDNIPQSPTKSTSPR